MVVMMDIEISCKGHCEKLSHFVDHLSHTVTVFIGLQLYRIYVTGNCLLLSSFVIPAHQGCKSGGIVVLHITNM